MKRLLVSPFSLSLSLSLLLTLWSGFSVHADPMACLQQVVKNNKYLEDKNLTGRDFACARTKPEVVAAVRVLCNENETDISAQYKKYRSFEVPYDETYDKFLHSSDPAERGVLGNDIARDERDWMLFGFRDAIDAAMGVLDSDLNCNGL